MSHKTYLNILKGGVFLSFFVLYFVFSGLLFPYITSKQLSFNILIEVLTVFWVVFMVKFPDYRPKRSWITLGLTGFIAVLLLTSFTGVDFNLSFWGDVERMLGVFHLAHFFLFYIIIITAFRTKNDWLSLLAVSVIAATVESLLVIFDVNYGTFGNTSYVSGYMIFNLYFALILIFRQKNIALRIAYIFSILMMLISMNIASTRGAFVGLGFSILLLFFLLAAFNKNKKIKYASITLTAVFVGFIILIFASSGSAWVKNSALLSRITQINTNTETFKTRLISWSAAFQDFPNHPWLGTGYGNYAITFDKFFDPQFYIYTNSASYFDHAHNNLIDILSTTGIIGLTAYLLIFAAVLYYLVSGFRKDKIGLTEFILLISMIAAYFIQNIVLFDSFVTYFSLMITFGFIYWLSQENEDTAIKTQKDAEGFTFLAVGLLMLFVIYQYNIEPFKMLRGTIRAQYEANAKNDLLGAINIYKQALSYGTPIDRDSRTSLIQLILTKSNLLSRTDNKTANGVFDYAIELAEKNLQYNPNDSFNLMLLSQVLNTAAAFNKDDPQKAERYSKEAEEAINKTIASTPRRIPMYFIKAQIYLYRGDNKKAIETLKYAISLNPEYDEAVCQLAKAYFITGDQKSGYEQMGRCIDSGGADTIDSTDQVNDLINHFLQKKDLPKVVKLLEQLTALDPNDAKIWASLAEVYRQDGEKEKAIKAAEKAAEIDPNLKSSAEAFIKSLK